jgi:hypothetical protein
VSHLRQIGSGDGGCLGLKTGQGMGEPLLGSGVGRDGRRRLNGGLWRPEGGAMTDQIGRMPAGPDLRALC